MNKNKNMSGFTKWYDDLELYKKVLLTEDLFVTNRAGQDDQITMSQYYSLLIARRYDRTPLTKHNERSIQSTPLRQLEREHGIQFPSFRLLLLVKCPEYANDAEKQSLSLLQLATTAHRNRAATNTVECRICLTTKPLNDMKTILPCGHVFCGDCLYTQWNNRSHQARVCALCRGRMVRTKRLYF